MENKFQKALENVNMRLYYSDCSKCFVNTKSKNENELDKAIKENCSNCNLKKDIATLQDLIDKFNFLQDYNHQLEEELFGKRKNIMKNKYSEALKLLSSCSYQTTKFIDNCEIDEAKETLEELIDDYQDYATVKMEYEKELDVYKKALYITIDLIYGKKGSFVIPHNRRAYKEWVLKESEKQ